MQAMRYLLSPGFFLFLVNLVGVSSLKGFTLALVAANLFGRLNETTKTCDYNTYSSCLLNAKKRDKCKINECNDINNIGLD